MTATALPTTGTTGTAPIDSPRRPSALRRTALVAAAVPALFLPTIWTVNISRMFLTGVESDHRFHQLTGQGLILTAMWLAALVPMVRAGWAGRRPPTTAALLHLTFAGVAAGLAVFASGGGAPFLATLIAITGVLVWAAIPVRPRLRGIVSGVDPVLAPLALVSAALYAPFVLDHIALQNAATGYHAQNPHYYDMAWVSVVMVLVAGLAAIVPAARKLALWTTIGTLVIGVAGLTLTDERVVWFGLAAALGATGTAAVIARLRAAQSLTFTA
jgi:hypothetical protein